MIETIEEYNELAIMADTAEECLQSLRFGSHAFLISTLLTKYGIKSDRLTSIKEARRLCDEFIMTQVFEEL